MNQLVVVLVALYKYTNFPVRILHPLLENIDGIKPYTIFFKDCDDAGAFNPPTGRELESFVKLINMLSPKLVGLSVLSPYVPIAKKLTGLIKNNNPSSLVIWGGIHPTISPESCIDEADMLCVGEGEGAITDLVEHLRDGRSYHSIKNLWIRNGNHIIKNPMRPLIQDLDSLPFPCYGNSSYYFIDSNRMTKNDGQLLNNGPMVLVSRGCSYSCSYCVNSVFRPLFKNLGPYIRRRSVNNIIREIKEYLILYGNITEHVCFGSDAFVTDESWLDEFAASYKKEIGLPFIATCHPNNINSIVLDKLVNAGVEEIQFGLQTGSDYIRNHIFHRPEKNEEFFRLAHEISGYNVKGLYDLIMDNSYETEHSLKGTIEFLLRLPKPLHFNLFSLQYFPNYPLTNRLLEDKFIQEEETNGDILMKATRNWHFVPKLLPYTKKQILQNIIWLVTHNEVKDDIVKYAVFGNSSGSKFCLMYLNFKSIIMGKILDRESILCRRCRWIWYFIEAFRFILKGDLKSLYFKVKRHMQITRYRKIISKKQEEERTAFIFHEGVM